MPGWIGLCAGLAVLIVVVIVSYWVGCSRGAGAADQRWGTWTGITVQELERRQFDHELREFRRHIGRPVDEWPEQTRED